MILGVLVSENNTITEAQFPRKSLESETQVPRIEDIGSSVTEKDYPYRRLEAKDCIKRGPRLSGLAPLL
jgi:hypothetical protein